MEGAVKVGKCLAKQLVWNHKQTPEQAVAPYRVA